MSRLRVHLLTMVCLALAAGRLALGELPAARGQTAPESRRPTRTDSYGDPLPDGALARMGSIRPTVKGFQRVGHGHHADVLAVSPDGKLVASGALHDPTLRLWDAATGKPLHQRETANDWVSACGFSADGKIVLSGGYNDAIQMCTIQMWDASTAKELHRFTFKSSLQVGGFVRMDQVVLTQDVVLMHLSPDGSHLTGVGVHTNFDRKATAILRVWDTTTEKLLTDRPFRIDAHYIVNPDGSGRGTWQVHSRFTPDGKSVTVRTHRGLSFEDTASGRETLTIAGDLGRPLAISPDGRLVAASEFEPLDDPFNGYKVRAVVLAESLTGKEVLRLDTGHIRHLDFSPDGRLLATADAASIRLWDSTTGQQVLRRAWPKEIQTNPEVCPVLSFAFALHGRAVATGLPDGTLLVWDVGHERQPATLGGHTIDGTLFDQLWADLSADDAGKAYRATRALSFPQATPFFKARLHPAQLDAKRVEKLIADLDGEQFAAREAATKELAMIADLAEPLLKRARETNPAAEVRRRIDRLLAARSVRPSGERLQTLRAIAALEQIGSPEARAVLWQLASGVDKAWETREAKQALERLERRAVPRSGRQGDR